MSFNFFYKILFVSNAKIRRISEFCVNRVHIRSKAVLPIQRGFTPLNDILFKKFNLKGVQTMQGMI